MAAIEDKLKITIMGSAIIRELVLFNASILSLVAPKVPRILRNIKAPAIVVALI
jgi:hypothetical protein